MSKDKFRLNDYLGHILQAISRISRYTHGLSEVDFLTNEMAQDAVIRNIEIIGEAARNIDRDYPNFTQKYSKIPWSDLYWMRNRVSHGYFSVDLEIIWKTVERDIPELESQISDILKA